MQLPPRLLTQVITAPRSPLGKEVWLDTAVVLPADAPGSWREILGGTQATARDGFLLVGDILTRFPVGLLAPEDWMEAGPQHPCKKTLVFTFGPGLSRNMPKRERGFGGA